MRTKRNIRYSLLVGMLSLIMGVMPDAVLAEELTYSFTITKDDFTTVSYADNNKPHFSIAVCTTDETNTLEVEWQSNQVFQNYGVMQWQKNNGYIYNTTDLGSIVSVEVTSTSGTFSSYYGTSEHPLSDTVAQDGFFTIVNGNATGKTTQVVVTFVYDNSGDTNVSAPRFSLPSGTYMEDQQVFVNNYADKYKYFFTTDDTTPDCDGELNALGTSQVYDNEVGVAIINTTILRMIAVDSEGNKSRVSKASYTINKPVVFESLEALVVAELESGTWVKVSFGNVPIKDFYLNSQEKKSGVIFDIQKADNDIEIYYSAEEVPAEWFVGGELSGTMTCPWKLYNDTWELAPESGSWSWSELTYIAPVQRELTSLEIIGSPLKTNYYAGETYDPTGLEVVAHYNDGVTMVVTGEVSWAFNPKVLSASTRNVSITATYNNVSTTKVVTVSVTKKAAPQNSASIKMAVGDDLYFSTETVPYDASLTIRVTEGEEYITVSEGKITAKAPGTAIVDITFAGDDEYLSATKNLSVVVVMAEDTGINSNHINGNMLIYDITGRKIQALQRGVNIVDRKKVAVQ